MEIPAMRPILDAAGWSADRLNEPEFIGTFDPILPSPFKITETATAVHAAVGLAVSDIWKQRTGRPQGVSIDTAHATASMCSTKFLRLDGEKVNTERNEVMGMYPAKHGRWSYLHCNFPHHRAAILQLLGTDEDRQKVAKAVAEWDALELEEAIISAGAAGGAVRSRTEWAEHPQGRAVASLPLMEIEKISDSDPEPLADADRPLSNIRVLDLTRVLAGPTCARTLAEHGADVMKVSAKHLPFILYQEYDTGHGKLSTYLDLRDEVDHRTLLDHLTRECDIFSQGYRPESLANRGLSPAELAKLRPGIICVSLSAFGHEGPWASRRGFDTVIQAVSGIALRQGELFPKDGNGPQFYPAAAIDYLTGYLMAFGALVALRKRAVEGGAWLVRISLAQVGRWLQEQGELPIKEARGEELNTDRWTMSSDTPMGKLTHLAPVLQFSETPAGWVRPSVPLGYNDPAWPPQ